MSCLKLSYGSACATSIATTSGLSKRHGQHVVKPRLFFRVSSPAHRAHDERETVARLGLHTVVDLRTQAEVAQRGAAVIDPKMRPLHMPLFETARLNWISPAGQTPRATASRYFEIVSAGLDQFAKLVMHIAHAQNQPFLVSCSAGRDRTGIVVACLLDLVGVTDEAIDADSGESDPFDPNTRKAHARTILELLRATRDSFGSARQMLLSRNVPDGATLSS